MGGESKDWIHKSVNYICEQKQVQTRETVKCSTLTDNQEKNIVINLSLLHPIKELIVTMRYKSDVEGGDNPSDGAPRNYFAFVGNPDRPESMDKANRQRIELKSFELELNGSKTHPVKLTRDYVMKRLKPQGHSCGYKEGHVRDGGTEEIYTIPFALAPESLNPSGHMNFTKATNPKLHLNLLRHARVTQNSEAQTSTDSDELFIDILAVYYNWTIFDGGRVHNAFT